MLNIVNFAHGALYMVGAFVAYFLLNLAGLGYWWALILAPIAVGLVGVIIERTMLQMAGRPRPSLRPAADLRPRAHHPGRVPELFRFVGPALRHPAGTVGRPDPRLHVPAELPRLVVIFSLIVCVAVWYMIEKTKLGRHTCARHRNPTLVRAFGINVPLMIPR